MRKQMDPKHANIFTVGLLMRISCVCLSVFVLVLAMVLLRAASDLKINLVYLVFALTYVHVWKEDSGRGMVCICRFACVL